MVLAPISDRCRVELMLLLGNMDKYVLHAVMRIINSIKLRLFYRHLCLMQVEEGKTAYVLFRHRHLKSTLRLAIRLDTPRRIATVSVTHHIARQKPKVFQEFYTHLLSPNRYIRNIFFRTHSWPSAACAYEMLITYGISSSRRWYVSLTEII